MIEIELDPYDMESSATTFAFDACKVVYLLACEWGEYNVITYLEHELEFRPSSLLSVETLNEDSKELYYLLDEELHRQHYPGEPYTRNWNEI